ncbi:MAG TPA: hypothetical protein ENH10_01730 [Bacteroidetes bacterium]|nr:hypothetical protein BMS3Bbin04_00447 [bacterium BMS3Bbin04]HDO64739.1 hypothetical protein [Bacteroidota bacterium]HEX03864.1 hypothetical protein [Bacteroidota bacterium]
MIKKWSTFVTITALLAILPLHVHAQLLGEPSNDRTAWGFEATILGNLTHLNLSQVDNQIKNGPNHYFTTTDGYSSTWEQEGFADFLAYELRLGFRFHSLHAGLGYSQLPEQVAGFTMEQYGIPRQWQMKISSKEYYAYAAYLYPFNDWFSIGPMVSIGFGTIDGSLTDFIKQAEGAELTGTYTPFRAELRSRIKLTRYLSLDIGGGIRMGDVNNLEADYGTAGVSGIEGSTGPVQDYLPEKVVLEMSGWFVGGGITLLNPLGDY